jgi:hypothetical protein
MKNTLLILSLTVALVASSYGQYTIAVNSVTGGAFDNLVNTGTANTQITLPTDGDATGNSGQNNYVNDFSVFATSFVSGFGNVDLYKVGVKNASEGVAGNGAWADSSNAHAFTLNVVGNPGAHGSNPGPRWRVNTSRDNGTTQNGAWSDLVTGNNEISIGGTAFDRTVAVQIAGIVNYDLFSHDYTSGTDSIAVSSAVPEPSSYALLAGLFACTYMMVRRRSVS